MDSRTNAEAKRLFFEFYAKRPVQQSEQDHEFMLGGEPVVVEHGGERLAVRAWGAGPTVLLVHGLFGTGGQFRKLAPALVDAGLRVIAFDAPAHGGSPGNFVHSDEVVDAILSIQAALDGAVYGVVGHSVGAVWSLRARHAGLRVARAVCISAACDLRALFELFVRDVTASPTVLSRLRALLEAFEGEDLWSKYSAARIAPTDVLPGLIIHDRGDPVAAPDGAEELARAWPGSRLKWTRKLGHFRTVSNSDVVSEVSSFLQTTGDVCVPVAPEPRR
jgi:pimeloyl-ACP methyl ester carboxylesterase